MVLEKRKKWRAKLSFENMNHEDKDLCSMNRYLFEYISKLKGVFIKWFVRYNAIGSMIELQYMLHSSIFEKVELSVRIRNDFSSVQAREETMYIVTDFVLNCYYYHERNNHPLQTTILAKILNVEEKTVSSIIDKIKKKLFLLWEGKFYDD